jgi:hypothetical protein
MKKIILFLIFLSEISFGQNYDPLIQDLINKVNLDSLVNYVGVLSGEDSVVINDSLTIITHRVSSQGNDLAFEFIKKKMIGFGFDTIEQSYSETGKNLYSIQLGTKYPDEYFILCAHYDAVAQYCADDNASGVAGVLETARIFSKLDFNYSIIYAYWDEEEIGLIGSKYFAEQADSMAMNIRGVLNFEMSGWDSDNDGLIDVHTRPINESVLLANTLYTVDSVYNLPLELVIYNPGTASSDHSSFWYHDYSAIVFSEAYYGGDFNPYYHSSSDRIEHFNLPYFHNIVKLSTGTISTLANEGIITSVKETDDIISYLTINNYPNPFNNSTKIKYNLPYDSNVQINIYNSIGEQIKTILSDFRKAGSYSFDVTLKDRSTGVYFLIVSTDTQYKTHKIILLK